MCARATAPRASWPSACRRLLTHRLLPLHRSLHAVHDWHHAQYIENFGVMGWLDALFGTSRRFDKHQLELAAAAAVQARAGQKGEAAATSSSTISSSGAPASEGKKVL